MTKEEFKKLKVGDVLKEEYPYDRVPFRWIILEIDRKDGYIHYRNINTNEEFYKPYDIIFEPSTVTKVYEIEGFEV